MGKKQIVLATGCACLTVSVIAYLFWPASLNNPALKAREMLMEKLGARIAEIRPRCKVLVLSNPFTKEGSRFDEKSQFELAGVRGLKKGLGARTEVTVVFPDIRPDYLAHPETANIPADSPTPLSFLMMPESIDRLAELHPKCDVIVSLIGLPLGVDSLKIWNTKDPRAFALLLPDLRVIGGPAQVVDAFQRGKILAAVFEGRNSADPLIVTSNEISNVLQQNPRVFGY